MKVQTYVILCLAILLHGCTKGNASTEKGEGVLPRQVKHYDSLTKVTLPGSLPAVVKEYDDYIVNFNPSNRTPNYVAWELLGTETTGEYPRADFWQDTEIKGCPSAGAYKRSGYSRGHMFPAADAKFSREAMRQCFSMANMCPQLQALNGGAWKTLEDKERLWAARDSALVIVAGPVYQKADNLYIGAERVRVPSAFFKAIVAPYLDQPRGIAFLYPNSRCPGNMQNYALSIDELEALLGYDLFPALPDDIEAEVEKEFSFKKWERK